MPKKTAKRTFGITVFWVILLLVTTGSVFVALVVPMYGPFAPVSLQEGQVVTQDILAPQAITYESQVLTEQQRVAAERSVPSIYTSPDPSIARRQLESLRSALAFITSVKADAFASAEQMLGDLAAMENLDLGLDTARNILSLSDSRWQSVQQEAIVVLEQVMRGTIREDRLEDVRRSIPTLVSLSLPEDQTAIVAELVSAFVVPNSLYSEDLTEEARQKARASVSPVVRTYQTGETIVQRGQVLTGVDLEALGKLGLVQPQLTWRDLASAGALAALSVIFLIFYLRRNPTLRHDHRGVALIAVLYLTFLLIVRLIIPSQTVLPYIFPLAAYSLTVAVLFGAEPALISTLPLAILAAYNMPNPLELILYYLLSGCFGVLTLGRARRMTAFFFAGAAIASSGAVISIVYRLPGSAPDWQGIYNVVGAATLNGIASAGLTVLLQFFLAQFLGMTTALQLMEISRPDHPLLKKLLRNAPGTYQHSLQVANLAEQASERIGADTLLTRVGALYHDIGKIQNPMFFIENQVPGTPNPHDSLDPLTSSGVILHHANDGLELSRKHRLPRRIQDFILEHHGDMITRYQYAKALEAAGGDESQVDTKQFRYPGPRPGSRETAIVMLADGCEARVRAERPQDEEELHKLVKSVIQNRMSNGQLDNTNLTLRDLDAIADSFTATLRGMYHPRLEYPQLEPAAPPGAPLTAPPKAPPTVSAEVTRPVQAAPPSESETPSLEMPTRPHGSPENP